MTDPDNLPIQASLVSLADRNEHLNHIADTVFNNLKYQHDWTLLEIQHRDPRPLIKGLPPRRLYIHPDDQIAALQHHQDTGDSLLANAEIEWVLPVHITEKWTLSNLSKVFACIDDRESRSKRIVLATLNNDSTVVYYLIHEGMVKPRQN